MNIGKYSYAAHSEVYEDSPGIERYVQQSLVFTGQVSKTQVNVRQILQSLIFNEQSQADVIYLRQANQSLIFNDNSQINVVFSRGANQSLVVSDLSSLNVDYLRPLNQSLTFNQDISEIQIFNRQTEQTLTFSEQASRIHAILQTLIFSEQLTRIFDDIEIVNQTLTLDSSVSVNITVNKAVDQTLTFSDSVTHDAVYPRSTSDTLTFNQSTTAQLNIIKKANFGSNQSKTAGTSLAITGSLAVVAGDDVFVSYAGDDVGSNFSITDNLGNTYNIRKELIKSGQVKSQLWRSTVTSGGTLTTVTISWTTNVTAKAGVAAVFSRVGTEKLTDGVTATAAQCDSILSESFTIGDLWIGTHGYEGPNSDSIAPVSQTPTGALESGQNGTTGSGAGTNITCEQAYVIITSASSTGSLSANNSTASTRNNSGAGAAYGPKTF